LDAPIRVLFKSRHFSRGEAKKARHWGAARLKNAFDFGHECVSGARSAARGVGSSEIQWK
jgi:hypothetical protein